MPPSSHVFHYTGNLQLKLEAALLTWQNLFREKHGELNFSRFNIDETPPERLSEELGSPPFLAEKRLTLVRVPPNPKPKGESSWSKKEPKKTPQRPFPEYGEAKYWKKLVDAIPEDHIVAFVGAEHIPGLEKILLETATVKDFSTDDVWDFIQSRLPLITPANARLLMERIGGDMLLLENEIQKLALLPAITEADILENTIESAEVVVFEITDALLAGNVVRSKLLLRKFHSQYESENEFLSSILRPLRKTWIYAGLVSNGVLPGSAAELLELKPTPARILQSVPKGKLLALWNFYESLIQADMLLKTGKLVGDDRLLHHIESGLLKYSLALKGN